MSAVLGGFPGAFQIRGVSIDRDTVKTRASIAHTFSSGFELTAGYLGEYGSNVQQHAGFGTATVRFSELSSRGARREVSDRLAVNGDSHGVKDLFFVSTRWGWRARPIGGLSRPGT